MKMGGWVIVVVGVVRGGGGGGGMYGALDGWSPCRLSN